jgi:hypothetical protein
MRRSANDLVYDLMFRGWPGLVATIGIGLSFSFALAYGLFGGMAAAPRDGQYLLDDHGVITETCRTIWVAMRILEYVGIAGFVITLLSIAIGWWRATRVLDPQIGGRCYRFAFAVVAVVGFFAAITAAIVRCNVVGSAGK